MALPDSAESYWLSQQALTATTVAIVLRAWQLSMGDPARWATQLGLVVATITRAQAAAVLAAAAYVASALSEQSTERSPLAVINPVPLIGVTGAGLPVAQLYAGLPEQFRQHAARIHGEEVDLVDLTPDVHQVAFTATARQLEASVQTLMSDTGRAAESLEIAVRPGVGYVRMINPPSCDRCVVQAGKFFQWNAGFERHPRCDCRHVPSDRISANDIRVDPDAYFASLTPEGQDAAFGKAGAQAVRDGASISQVVNSRKGMRTAQVFGRNMQITTAGVTKRGQAGRAIRARGHNAATTPRLMPESIYRIAEDRDDALRLLRMNGYIDDQPSVVDLDAILRAA